MRLSSQQIFTTNSSQCAFIWCDEVEAAVSHLFRWSKVCSVCVCSDTPIYRLHECKNISLSVHMSEHRVYVCCSSVKLYKKLAQFSSTNWGICPHFSFKWGYTAGSLKCRIIWLILAQITAPGQEIVPHITSCETTMWRFTLSVFVHYKQTI